LIDWLIDSDEMSL